MSESPPSSCPPPSVLERLAGGDAVSDADRTHIENCSTCRAALNEITRNNALLGELSAAYKEDGIGEEARLVSEAIEGYEILGEIHRGGQGVVYRAIQQTTHRIVALKVLLQGAFATAGQRWRFEREIELVANLNHPNIVVIHDSGVTRLGQHYFAMEYIEGLPLTDDVAQHGLDLRQRLELLATVCRAVQHAHQNGIIHRDLKPDNILVTDRGVPKILDFGVARPADANLQSTTVRTNVGQLIGTLAYMSPEQVAGDPNQVDVRSDVYALGVIAYELLAGRLPHLLGDHMLHEAVRAIREDEPRRLGTIDPRCRGEIETIVAAALEKDAQRRYQSAADFAADIERYLRDEPIAAHPPSAVYQFRKFARRNRTLVAAAATVLAVLVIAAVVSTSLAIAEARQRREAEWQSYLANIVAADAALKLNDIRKVRARLGAAPPQHRRWEWNYLSAAIDQSPLVIRGHTGRVFAAAYHPLGNMIASAGEDDAIRLWHAASGRELRLFLGHEAPVWSLAFSPDGTQLVSGSWDTTVRLWNVANAEQETQLDAGERVYHIALSADGKTLAAGTFANIARIWNLADPTAPRDLQGHTGFVSSVAFSPDGTTLATASLVDGTVRLWDLDTDTERLRIEAQPYKPWSVTFSPDGNHIACACFDATVRLWDTRSGEPRHILHAHSSPVHDIAFTPDGSLLASASFDGTARLWDARSGAERTALTGYEGFVSTVDFSPDGAKLISGSFDQSLRLWDVGAALESRLLRGHDDAVNHVAFSPDQRLIATASHDATVRLWDPIIQDELAVLRGHEGPVRCVAFSPDARYLASAAEDHTARLWNAATGTLVRELCAHEDEVWAVAFSPDGSRLATGSRDETLRLWDARTGDPLTTIDCANKIMSLAFSGNGSAIAVMGYDPAFQMIDLGTGEPVRHFAAHRDAVPDAAFRPDDQRLASVSLDGTLRIWSVERQRTISHMRGPGVLLCAAWTADGSRVVTGSLDGSISLWEPDGGAELATLTGHDQAVQCLTFSPDGSRLASASDDATVRLWDALPYRVRYAQRRQTLDDRAAAEPILARLRQQGIPPDEIAARLRAYPSLSDPLRRAALNLLLRSSN